MTLQEGQSTDDKNLQRLEKKESEELERDKSGHYKGVTWSTTRREGEAWYPPNPTAFHPPQTLTPTNPQPFCPPQTLTPVLNPGAPPILLNMAA